MNGVEPFSKVTGVAMVRLAELNSPRISVLSVVVVAEESPLMTTSPIGAACVPTVLLKVVSPEAFAVSPLRLERALTVTPPLAATSGEKVGGVETRVMLPSKVRLPPAVKVIEVPSWTGSL